MALTNSYLKSVYETVEKRNPNEPEFQQAVYEVLREVMKTKPAEMIHRKVPYFPRFMQELPEAK